MPSVPSVPTVESAGDSEITNENDHNTSNPNSGQATDEEENIVELVPSEEIEYDKEGNIITGQGE